MRDYEENGGGPGFEGDWRRLGRLRAQVSKGETGRCYRKTRRYKEKIERC